MSRTVRKVSPFGRARGVSAFKRRLQRIARRMQDQQQRRDSEIDPVKKLRNFSWTWW